MPVEATYQVHALLQDALFKSCAREASASGLPATLPFAGKSGTAYNFTDTWFVGYSQAVTCGVWVGFDKPTKIYRGAFGKDLALPIWAQVMNSSLGAFPAQPIPVPTGLKQVEICRVSGLMPVDACRHLPGIIATEYATESEMPSLECDVHGGGVRSHDREVDQAGWPRAAAAVDLSHIRPITVNAPTLLAQSDLYRSVNPIVRSEGADSANVKVARATSPDGKDPGVQGGVQSNAPAAASSEEKEVRRAEPVRPMDLPTGDPVLTIPAPKPAEF